MAGRTLLLIADIGGYTKFMKVHRINLAHAQDVVAQLLEAVIDGARSRFKLSKLEGDAALFYAQLGPGESLAGLTEHIAAIRRAFLATRTRLEIDRLCNCEGCTQVGSMNIKFVAHVGEVALQKVKRFTELAGFDVIIVHRLLKNHVPVPEYVLMTEPLSGELPDVLRPHVVRQQEELEGVGPTAVYYLDLNAVASQLPAELAPSRLRAVMGWVRMTWRSLPYMVGAKKACDGFRNMDGVLGPPRPTSETALPPPASPPAQT